MSKMLISVLLIAMAITAYATDVTCKVVAISDGDTFTCLTDARQQIKIRMAEIDAPEKNQPYGSKAQQALSGMIFQQQVRINIQETDRYGRSVGRVHVGSIDVNANLVAIGAAWMYRQYSVDRSLSQLEDQARLSRRGLWALPESERMAPWDWRRTGRDKQQTAKAQEKPVSKSATIVPSAPSATTKLESTSEALVSKPPLSKSRRISALEDDSDDNGFSCARKTCKQISSCAEARYQLNQCGNSKLDRDGDGVPCESLCR